MGRDQRESCSSSTSYVFELPFVIYSPNYPQTPALPAGIGVLVGYWNIPFLLFKAPLL